MATNVTFARGAPGNNQVEIDRSALCGSGLFGAVWINGSSTPSWVDTLTVPYGSTTVTAYMQTTAFMCPTGSAPSPRTGMQVRNLTAMNGAPYIPITFTSGTTISRGTAYAGEFSSTTTRLAGTPGIRAVQLNVTGLASGTYQVRYEGQYYDDQSGLRLTSVYTTNVRLVVQRATLRANADADATITAGTPFTFRSWVESSNVTNTGANTFTYRIYDDGTGTVAFPAGGLQSATSVAIAGANPRTGYRSYALPTTSVPGTYCRMIEITIKPAYAIYNPQRNRQCVTVVAAPPPTTGTYTLTSTPANHEKGSPTNEPIEGTLIVVTPPCDTGQASGSPVSTVTWQLTGLGVNATTTTTIGNCNGAVINSTINTTVPAGSLNGLAGVGAVGSVTPAPTATTGIAMALTGVSAGNVSVYEVPYFRAYGNDISAAGCLDVPNAGQSGAIIGARNNNMAVAMPNLYSLSQFAAESAVNNYRAAVSDQIYGGAATEYAAIAFVAITPTAYKANTVLTSSFQPSFPASRNVPLRLQSFWGTTKRVCPSAVYAKVTDSSSLPGIVNLPLPAAGGTITDMGSKAATDNFYARGQGNVTIDHPGASVTAIGKYTVFANGDVRISDNIIANKPAVFNNNDATVTLIIAADNIYIDPGVTQVDAILIAQNDIYTCGNGFSAQAQATVHTACRTKLQINGSLTARNVHFQRSIGTRLLGQNNELSTDTVGNFAAESINYPYYLYFATPFLQDKAQSTFQSYFTPAPYF